MPRTKNHIETCLACGKMGSWKYIVPTDQGSHNFCTVECSDFARRSPMFKMVKSLTQERQRWKIEVNRLEGVEKRQEGEIEVLKMEIAQLRNVETEHLDSATSKSDEYSVAQVKDCKIVLVRIPENCAKSKSRSASPEVPKLEEPIQYVLQQNYDANALDSAENQNNSGIFSCVIVYSKCEMKFNNDQDLVNHCLQFHKKFLQTLWMEDNENDNDQENFEKFCKEIIIELLLAEYKHPLKRLNTFENWSNKSVNPEDLANADLLFTGSEDITKCVYCGNDMGKIEAKKFRTSSRKNYRLVLFENFLVKPSMY